MATEQQRVTDQVNRAEGNPQKVAALQKEAEALKAEENAINQDDLYVEMTFLKTLETYGWGVSHKQAGTDFARSGYPLWHANSAGRRNLRAGIAPPDSSHPKFHPSSGAIDYQIEADYAGLIAPGMPGAVIALGHPAVAYRRLMRFLESLNIPIVGVMRDSQNYVHAAEQGLGVHELLQSQTLKDLEAWAPMIGWIEQRLATAAKLTGHKTSMHQDLERGRPLDDGNGATQIAVASLV